MNLHICNLSGVYSSLIHEWDNNRLFSDFNIARAIQAAFCVNHFGQLTYINDAMWCLTEYSRSELLGIKLFDIDAHTRLDNWSQTWRKLKSDKSIMFLSQYLTKDNSTIDVQVSMRYVKQNGIEFGCGFVNRIFDQPLNYKTKYISNNIYLLQFYNWHIGEA